VLGCRETFLTIPSARSQGAKAQQKRERNAKGAPKEGKSTLKINEAAKNIQCTVCRQTFVRTLLNKSKSQTSTDPHSSPPHDFPNSSSMSKTSIAERKSLTASLVMKGHSRGFLISEHSILINHIFAAAIH